MEREYYVTFYKNDKPICGVWQMAENEECASQDAVYKLEARFGGAVEYDTVKVEY